ncbi:hypothetical protein [Mycoplana ramosa]|uniref:Terminase small subunit n=1 Tax=Mycoplana ramosa TaxID=40837 RepID=A0ABW3YTJ6_MYCRA
MTDAPKKRPKRAVSQQERERLQSPEHREHLKTIGFQKGRKKTGGTVPIPQEVKEALAKRTMDAVETLADVMLNSSNDNARVKAAAYFLDPFVAKAATQQEIKVDHRHHIAGLLAEINQARLKDDRKTIDVTPVIDVTPIIEPVTVKDADND